MPATDCELASMDDQRPVEAEEGSAIPSSGPTAVVPSSTPPFPATMRPSFSSETVIENKAVSVASNDCSSARSSPAEASPAKPALTSPTASDGTVEPSAATSQMASASDSLASTGTSLAQVPEPQAAPAVSPSSTFGGSDAEKNFSSVLTFKGISVTLENNSVWKQFNTCGTEMILTKQGRRMFPYCRYRLAGLDPEQYYSLVLSIVPADQYRYRWSTEKWEVSGVAENQSQGLIRAYSHHYSPCRGSDWMGSLVSFYKVKLTNNPQDQEGHVILQSMHRYIPRLHVIPALDRDTPTPDRPFITGPESMTFTFPQTEFMAVTTYQNFRITQLKIHHNPFARGFRENGNNSRLTETVKADPPVLTTEEPSKSKEDGVDMSAKTPSDAASLSNEQETRLVLKPIMFSPASKDEPFARYVRGGLGELVLVQKRPLAEPDKGSQADGGTPNKQPCVTETPKATRTASPGSSPWYRKRRKRMNRRWANSRGRAWKAAAASPPAVNNNQSSSAAMQPELDDIEGLLFVSFTSKEALDIHVRESPAAAATSPASPDSSTTPAQEKPAGNATPETDEEKVARLEAILLKDLTVLKYRQVIHPVLQEVGLKLSSLDATKPIDLQYLGVSLPLPPPVLPAQGSDTTAAGPGKEGLPFISRTGKTSDMTKIKGWRNKFIRSKETSLPNRDEGSQKNLSAFCSNMLDEYLESEAQQISERAAAFSTNPEGVVAYQLPAKSSSYVKTLDSALKHRNAAAKVPAGVSKPCPLSHKPLLYSALTEPAPPLKRSPVQRSAPPPALVSGSAGSGSPSARSSACHSAVSPRPATSSSQGKGVTHRHTGLTKFQLKLLQMETEAFSQGLNPTQLTTERLTVALSAILTKEMQPSQVLKMPRYSKDKAPSSLCGKDFCRLGCVCSSINPPKREPLPCQRPECIFGCGCLKRKIAAQTMATPPEAKEPPRPVNSAANGEHEAKPRPGSHSTKLWSRNIGDVDSEPLFTPESAPPRPLAVKSLKRSTAPQTIREEDKDPVYKYLESFLTCARVREFNSKPPPEVTIDLKIPEAPKPNAAAKPEKMSDDQPKIYYRTIVTKEKAGRIISNETHARKQIEIQSECQWDQDRKMVLERLYRRIKQNQMSKRFHLGPYCIRLVTKIFMQKPSGSVVTYRVRISKPSVIFNAEEDDDNCDDSEEERNDSLDENMDAKEEDGPSEECEMRVGVLPFLSGVLPAGRLRARKKPAGCQATGLIQVNGKSYNQARLLLGNMGSLHPANRLAAHLTGRLHCLGAASGKSSKKPDVTLKFNTSSTLDTKNAGAVAPPITAARKIANLKTQTQTAAQSLPPDFWKKASVTLPQQAKSSSPVAAVQTFAPSQRSTIFQSSCSSSPVSLTVSPSLKTPSFLGQSGTYSFRICPPTNQGGKGQKLPGVALPGGFTLIQLPKPAADGALKSEAINNALSIGNDQPQKDPLDLSAGDSKRLALNSHNKEKEGSSGRAAEPGSGGKTPSDEGNKADSGKAAEKFDANLDIASDDESSDSAEDDADTGEDEDQVDIETVEEAKQGMAIAKLKEAAKQMLQDSRNNLGPLLKPKNQRDARDECSNNRRRKIHTVLERQRRSQQRDRFDRLQTILGSNPRLPRLHLLSLAVNEIRNLQETSKYLVEKKKRLVQMQSIYVKALSRLSGKSEELINHKLKEVYEMQKVREKTMKWNPFFSRLLQSRAALLQSATEQPEPKRETLLQPTLSASPLQALAHAAQSGALKATPPLQPNIDGAAAQTSASTPTPHSLPRVAAATTAAAAAPSPAEAAAPSLQAEEQPGEPASSQAQSTTEVPASQDGDPPLFSSPNKPPAALSKSIALPLIRSKTGRIILPSSLKPLGQGFYTLTIMKTKQSGMEDGVEPSAAPQPPSVDSSKNGEKSVGSEGCSESESSHALKDKTAKPSNAESKRSGAKTPLAGLALLNKSIFVSPEGGAAVGLNMEVPSARLSFQQINDLPASAVHQLGKAIMRRGRGRPPKIAPKETKTQPAEEGVHKNGGAKRTSAAVEKRHNPAPPKRKRGRPRKVTPASARGLQKAPSGSGSSASHVVSSPRLLQRLKSSRTTSNTSRPLTRGALGKDFPSAKKRSWIDVEKELEPEVDSE